MIGIDAKALELRCLAGYLAIYDGGEYARVVTDPTIDIHVYNQERFGVATRDISKRLLYAVLLQHVDELLDAAHHRVAVAERGHSVLHGELGVGLAAGGALEFQPQRVTGRQDQHVSDPGHHALTSQPLPLACALLGRAGVFPAVLDAAEPARRRQVGPQQHGAAGAEAGFGL